jgi:predicted pyridoxine 5'-phosphate oxidase superfamily flavin-nucleotide-binding protein
MADDPLVAQLVQGASLGLLGIQPHTRRRNRMNGNVEAIDAAGFLVEVQQSFGNCPKYIQAREPLFAAGQPAAPAQRLDGLDDAARALIARADTFFIASAFPQHAADGDEADPAAQGVDVSHRGGLPGFVRVGEDGVLTVPDFTGNRFFHTLGNLSVHPRAGLLFIDFESGDLLHLTATAEIVWDGPEVAAFEGAERLLRLRVEQVLRRPGALPLRWGGAEVSPHLVRMGHWAD